MFRKNPGKNEVDRIDSNETQGIIGNIQCVSVDDEKNLARPEMYRTLVNGRILSNSSL